MINIISFASIAKGSDALPDHPYNNPVLLSTYGSEVVAKKV